MRTLSLPFVLFFLLLGISSCRKANEDRLAIQRLAGAWSWQETAGGIAAQKYTPANTGETRTLQFFADGRYQLLRNDTLSEQGTFSISKEISIIDNREKDAINFSGSNPEIILLLTSDRLELFDNFTDGFGSTYVRK